MPPFFWTGLVGTAVSGRSGWSGGAILTVWLFFAGIALLVLLLRARRKKKQLMIRLADLTDEHKDLSEFLSRFASGIRGDDGIAGALHVTAVGIAEKLHAESVAIYACQGKELVCVGVAGPYLLIHAKDETIFGDARRLQEALRRERIVIGEGFLGVLADRGEAELLPDASIDPRLADYPQAMKLESLMAVPLLRDGKLLGYAVALNNLVQKWQSFSREQFKRLQNLTAEIIMVSQLMQVFGEISNRERIDQELGFARSLQQALLPPPFPPWEEFTITARTRSAKEVNGDFYDFIRIDDDRMLVLLGDACGKGIPACLLALMTRSFARSLSDNFTTLTAFLQDLNAKLFRDTEADRFITLGCCLLDRRHWLMEFGRAGHTDLITYVHHHLRELSPDGTALGILPRDIATFETICIAMDPDTHAILFSDGLTEATDAHGEEFGVRHLSQAFFDGCEQSDDPEEILQTVVHRVSSFEHRQSDDQTIVLISRRGAARA
ncbi:MAG: SpoIIE family protein phosphatase [Victivallaceae bacterium]|nr:SpoIIE family protein phosphatase [Victivallaceae bacterium]